MTTHAEKKIALVTGASRGLGAALAEALAKRGYHVMAVARTQGGLEDLDDRIQAAGGSASLAPLDLSDEKQAEHLASAIAGRWGKLHLWAHTMIHAAPLTPTSHIDKSDFDPSVKVNFKATSVLIPLISPLLLAGEGTALFFDDPRAGQPFFGSYGATKAGQIALARSWAAETVKIGPRVVVAAPAPMETATRARFFPGEDRTPLTSCHAEAERILSDL